MQRKGQAMKKQLAAVFGLVAALGAAPVFAGDHGYNDSVYAAPRTASAGDSRMVAKGDHTMQQRVADRHGHGSASARSDPAREADARTPRAAGLEDFFRWSDLGSRNGGAP